MPALGRNRPSGGDSAGPGRVQAARIRLCRLWEGTCRQEGSLRVREGTEEVGKGLERSRKVWRDREGSRECWRGWRG